MNQAQIDAIMQGILEKVMSGDMAGFDMTVEGLSHDTCIQIIKNFGRQAAQAAAMYGEQLGIK